VTDQDGKLPHHIPTSELYETAAGTERLNSNHCIHLRTCEMCQQVLEAFITGVVGKAIQHHHGPRQAAA
jgi:hypothetical protein